MNEYQRLTDEDLTVTINAPEHGDMTKFLLYAHRLWELENKIKSDEIVEERPVLYSERVELEKYYYDWITRNNIADMPNSVIAFLGILGWIAPPKERIEKRVAELRGEKI